MTPASNPGTPTPPAGICVVAPVPDSVVPAPGSADAYKISDADRNAVLTAASSLDVPVSVRNKLYAALGRSLQKPWVPATVLARWSEDSENAGTKFAFLKEWVQHTKFGHVQIREQHIQRSEQFKAITFGWSTKMDLDIKYQSATNPTGASYVNKLIAKAQTKAHPFFPKDKGMRLYKILAEVTEGKREASNKEKSYALEGSMEENEDAFKALEGAMQNNVREVLDAGDAGDDGKKKSRGKAKAKAEPAPVSAVEPAKKKEVALKLAACLNKLNAKEVEMSTMRTRLASTKPGMKQLLDVHLGNLEDLKGKIEPLVLNGDEDVDLAGEAAAFLQDKDMKNDIRLASQQLK